MVLEFTRDEIIDTLKSLGYEITRSKDEELRSRRTILSKNKSYYVLVGDEKKTLNEVFKMEILKSITK